MTLFWQSTFLPISSGVTFYPNLGAYELLTERLIEECGDGIFVFDREQRYTLWNPAMERLFGLQADRVLGRRASDVFPSFARSGMDRDYATALLGETVSLESQPFHMPETGRAGQVNIRYVPLTNRYGYVTEVLGLVRDVTQERREIERPRPTSRVAFTSGIVTATPLTGAPEHRLGPVGEEGGREGEEATPAIAIPADVIATTAHELRTPINAILGYVEILTRELVGPLTLPQLDHLGHIAMSARHLLAVANRVLGLANAEAGTTVNTLPVQQRRSSLASAVSAALTLVRPQAEARGVHLSSSINEELDVWYYGDPGLVKQILINLLSNAVKFTTAGGRVVVFAGEAAETDEHSITVRRRTYLRVDDTGIGIAPERLEAMFEPFVQGPPTQASNNGDAPHGTGLGLTISRRLARLMGGDVTVTSTPNAGSQFTLWLPTDEISLSRT